MTFVVGLTGGIGSGKTLISDRLSELGTPIIDTDVVAREVVRPGQPALLALVDTFGDQILQPDGKLNRDRLRELAFSCAENKRALDHITHPAIRSATKQQIAMASYPFCLVVIPLLTPDSKFRPSLHRILTVSAKQDVRVERVMKRNQWSREHVLKIMRTQLSDKERESFADDIIDNSGNKDNALTQADQYHQKYLELAKLHRMNANSSDTVRG